MPHDFRRGLVEIGDHRIEAETRIVALSAADPATIIPMAERIGIDAPMFSQDDLRLIFIGLGVCRGVEMPRAFRVIAAALRNDGFWWNGGRHEFSKPVGGPLWHDESLAALFTSEFSCPAAAQYWCERLKTLYRRELEAREHLQYAAQILAEA